MVVSRARDVYVSLIPKYGKISAVAALCLDDAWASDHHSGVNRLYRRKGVMAKDLYHIWTSADVLLHPSSLSHSRHRDCCRAAISSTHLDRFRHCGSSAAPHWIWPWTSLHLRRVAHCCRASLSALPVVHGFSHSASRLAVAALFLIRRRTNSPMRIHNASTTNPQHVRPVINTAVRFSTFESRTGVHSHTLQS